ncbi:BTB domain-containing protein [Mycena venus]|uniref:BTB domain-containing protein n=1 Tax=Mycena venus TaxID=2733690 RepID=A0A8H6YP99_9AGAR|nr:BTB domain-containing protein [Mycena venus]
MDSDAITAADEPHGQNQPVHDDKYFFDDGDCMFLADGVLFKLHKLFLCRDPESMFRGMFSMPQNQMMDLDLITLSGDTAEEFRELCWVVYALPNEIYLQATPDADIPKLLKVAKMSHKYSLPTFESWALDMILIQCKPLAGAPGHLSVCGEDILLDLMTLALLSNHSQLLDLVEENWLSRLRTGNLPCKCALIAGEKHGRTVFLAEVYYHLNKELGKTRLPTTSPFSHLNLTDTQLLRLLSGSTLLSNFWTHLRRDPLPQKSSQCYGQHHSCLQVWSGAPWAQDTFDPVAGLKAVQNYFTGGWKQRCPGLHIEQVITDFRVVDYFFGHQNS